MRSIFNILLLLLMAVEAMAGGLWTADNLRDPRMYGTGRHVLDYYEYLSREERDSIDIVCEQMRNENGVETVVVIIDDVDGYQNELSEELFKTWNLDNYGGAILLLVSAEEYDNSTFYTNYDEEDSDMPRKLLDYIVKHEIKDDFSQDDLQCYTRVRNALVAIRESIRDKEYREKAIAYYANKSGDIEWYLFDFFLFFWLFDMAFIGTMLSYSANGKKKICETEKEFQLAADNSKEDEAQITYRNKIQGKDWSVWAGHGCLRYLAVDFGFISVLIATAIDETSTMTGICALIIYATAMALIWTLMAHIAIKHKAGEPSEQMMRMELVRQSMTLAFFRLVAPWVGIPYTLHLKRQIDKIKTSRIK